MREKLVKLYQVTEQDIYVTNLDYWQIAHYPKGLDSIARVSDAPEMAVLSEKIDVETVEIRKHFFAESRGYPHDTFRREYYIAIDRKTAGIFGIEIEENERLRKHAELMRYESVLDRQQMKEYQREFYMVLNAPWYYRLWWAFTRGLPQED